MIAEAPPGFLTDITPPSPPPAPLRPEAVRRAVTTLVSSVTSQVESSIGQFIHPAVLQVMASELTRAMNNEVTVLEETALEDLSRARPNVDAFIAECVDHFTNPGLVDWIEDSSKRDEAIVHVNKLHRYMDKRDGNHVRTQFQEYLLFIMDYLNIRNEMRSNSLYDVCQNLKDYLRADLGAKNPELDYVARSVNRACYGVREITNNASHTTADMTEAEVYELSTCFKTLGATLPRIAKECYKPLAPPAASQGNGDAGDALSALHKLSPADGQNLLQHGNEGWQNPSTTDVPASTTLSTLSSPPQPSGRGWEQLTSSSATSPQRPRGPTTARPTQAALEAAAHYQLFYDRPNEIPSEASAHVTPKMFRRMLNHVKLVPKATLCDKQPGHDQTCPKSHSYLEVMKYNPLYKLSGCRQIDHFWVKEVAEDADCVCVHLNTGVDELAAIMKSKKLRCARGDGCTDQSCLKSHSFEEMCWFNPKYKTTKCDPTCRRSSIECLFSHEGERVRGLTDEVDYVGKDVPMLFIERTHKKLADALEAHRFLRSSAP